SRRARGRLTIQKAVVADESGPVTAVWFNQPWLKDRLVPGTTVRLRGQLKNREFQVREYDVGEADATADFAPVYPATEDLSPKRLRELVLQALPHAVYDPLPAALRVQERLPGRAD